MSARAHRWSWRALALVVVCCIADASAAQIATATLDGTVRDETGGPLPGVSLALKSTSTGATRTATTDAAGRYRIAALDPGTYDLRAELQNFKAAARTGIVLTVGGTTQVDLQMNLGTLSEVVTVESQAPLIEPNKMDVSRVVTAAEIQALPISGRNFVDFVKLSSGVTTGRENVGGGAFKEPDVGVGSAAAPRLSFAGQPELHTMVQVDGADNVQTFTGLPRATPSQEAAQEFRVLNSAYLAEYGRSLGGFVNIVTRSGTNRTDGSLYYFGVHDSMNARSILNTPGADRLHQHQFGVTLGMPLAPDRVFLFANWEGQRREVSNRFSRVVLDNIDALNAVRRQFNLSPETTNQLLLNHYNSAMVKVDARGAMHTASTRVNFLYSDTDNFLGGGGRASPTSSTARDNITKDFAAVENLVSVLSPGLINEARFQGAYRSFDFPSVLKEPAIDISNFIIMGKSTSDVDFYSERRLQLSDSLTRTAGSHQIKGGVDLNFLREESEFHAFFPARIIFPSLAAFQTFTPAVFWWPYLKAAPTYPGIDTSWTNDMPSEQWRTATQWSLSYSSYGLYAQDQWRAGPRLSLTYGLRYDFERYPSGYITERDMNNVQPRVGASFAYRFRCHPRRVRHLPRSARQQHRSALQRVLQLERRLSAQFARVVPDRRANRSAVPTANRRRGRGTGGGGDVPVDGTGANDQQRVAGRYPRWRRANAVQPSGERADLAGSGPRSCGDGWVSLPRRARHHRPHRQPECRADRHAAVRQAVVRGRTTVPRARRRVRANQYGALQLSRHDDRAGAALRRACGFPRQLHAGQGSQQRRFAGEPGRHTRGPGHRERDGPIATGRAAPVHAQRDRPGTWRGPGQRSGDARKRPPVQHLRRPRR